jgi:DNA polymerase-3 subunit delta
MAKKDKKERLNYNAELKALQEQGPGRLYMLFGPEDYLREAYLTEMRKLCVPSEDDFSYQRFDGPNLDMGALREAVDALPFFSEKRMVEVRDYDINACRENDCARLKEIIADVPDWCTLCFVFGASYAPDGRTAAVKALKKAAHCVEFTEQEQGALARWVVNRFRALGKGAALNDAEYLIFLSGTRMNALIPEIEKAAAYAAGETVTRGDIDATANRLPEADVFELTDCIARRRFDDAAALLRDLLADKNNHPIMLNALIGQQLRRMYAFKAGQAAHRSRADIMELCGLRYDFVFEKLSAAAKPFSLNQLAELVKLSAEYDFRMKSTGQDPQALLSELFARIAAEA